MAKLNPTRLSTFLIYTQKWTLTGRKNSYHLIMGITKTLLYSANHVESNYTFTVEGWIENPPVYVLISIYLLT